MNQVPARLNTGSSVHPSARQQLEQDIPFHQKQIAREKVNVIFSLLPSFSFCLTEQREARQREILQITNPITVVVLTAPCQL